MTQYHCYGTRTSSSYVHTLSWLQIDGLVQERRNSSALAMELCLSWTKPSIYSRNSFILLWSKTVSPISGLYLKKPSSFCGIFPHSDRQNIYYITVTLQWAPWRLKSPAFGLLAQPCFRRTSKKTLKLQMRGLIKPHKWKWPILRQFMKVTYSMSGSSDMVKSVDSESRGNEQCLLWRG